MPWGRLAEMPRRRALSFFDARVQTRVYSSSSGSAHTPMAARGTRPLARVSWIIAEYYLDAVKKLSACATILPDVRRLFRSRRSVGQFGTRCRDHAFTPDDLADPLRRPASAALFNLPGFASTQRSCRDKVRRPACSRWSTTKKRSPRTGKCCSKRLACSLRRSLSWEAWFTSSRSIQRTET